LDEYCAPLVRDYLKSKGKDSLILKSDAYGKEYQFSHSINSSIISGFLFQDQFIKVESIKGIWNRKYAAPYTFDTEMTALNSPFLKEAHFLLFGFLNASTAFSLDKLQSILSAENKLRQLLIADTVGLDVPSTIFSNNKEDIFKFLETHQDQVVVKMQGVISWSMEGSSDFFYTKKISAKDLEHSTVLNSYPMIYQQLVEKEYELRIIYVDGECFCGKIPSLPAHIIDWRVPGVQFNWEKSTIPESVKNKLKNLMDKLDLKFGAIDVIKSVDGKYYFLEVNPTGEWGMLQKDLDFPINEHIAETLIRNS